MKKFIITINIIFAFSINVFSQDTNDIKKNQNKIYISYHFGGGGFKAPKRGGANMYLNLEFHRQKSFNYGIDIMTGFYDSPNLNKNPSPTEIKNYDLEPGSPLPKRRIYDGVKKDDVNALSFYISKGLVMDKILINFQLGPSLIAINQREFEYSYSPAFGTFSGGSPSHLSTKSKGTYQYIVGAYVSANAQLKLGGIVIIELSPFANINAKEILLGIRLGLGLGKIYK